MEYKGCKCFNLHQSFRRTLWTTISEFGKHYRSGFHHPHTTFRIVYPSAAYVLGRQTTCYHVTWLRTTFIQQNRLNYRVIHQARKPEGREDSRRRRVHQADSPTLR